jgi:hypothetical protein
LGLSDRILNLVQDRNAESPTYLCNDDAMIQREIRRYLRSLDQAQGCAVLGTGGTKGVGGDVTVGEYL